MLWSLGSKPRSISCAELPMVSATLEDTFPPQGQADQIKWRPGKLSSLCSADYGLRDGCTCLACSRTFKETVHVKCKMVLQRWLVPPSIGPAAVGSLRPYTHTLHMPSQHLPMPLLLVWSIGCFAAATLRVCSWLPHAAHVWHTCPGLRLM